MAKVAIQGGVKNYLGNQKTVGNVPLKWQSGPDAPDTELAYITKAEKNLLLKKDLHGSLKNGPNTGPEGIMSLDSQGDKGTYGDTGQSYGDRQTTDKSPEVGDTSAFDFNNRTQTYELSKKAKDQQAVNDYVQGKLGYQKGKKPSFFGGPGSLKQRQQVYNKQRALGWAAKQRARKIKGIDDLIAETYVANPHMDIAEIRDALMSQYDSKNKTMTGLEGFNTGKLGMNYGPTQLGPLGLNTKNIKGETMSTNYLSTTPSLDSRLSAPGMLGFAVDKLQGPVNVNNLMSSIDRINQIDTMVDKGITQTDINDYYDKAQGKGKYDIFGGGGDGGGPQPYLPFDYNTGAATTEVVEPYTNDFTYRFGNEQKVGDNVLRGYAADGGIMGTRARRAMGGIMNRIDQRQQFFLGGIGKAIGKIGKAAGKVLSSDIGKAAIAGAAFYYGGGGTFAPGGSSTFSPGTFFSRKNPLLFSSKIVDGVSKQVFNPLKFAGLTTLGGALAGPAKVDQMPGDDGAKGGRLKDSRGNEVIPSEIRAEIDEAYESGDPEQIKRIEDYYAFLSPTEQYLPYSNYGSQGYRTTVATGGRIRAEEGGLMNLGGMEKDYRAEGGFVPIGKQEKADDVPARLSVNEFVFTADAVRNAGSGDIDKGAEVMENMMKNLENGGTVSEESQGNTGAQNMFSVSERIGEVI